MANPSCPKCGEEMKIGAYQGPQPLFNCDNCGIDCWRPPKKVVEPPKPEPPKEEIKEPEVPPEEKPKETIPDRYGGEPEEPEKKPPSKKTKKRRK